MSRVVLAAALTTCLTTVATAHDEDWRKIADREPPVQGDLWRATDPQPISLNFDSSGMTLLSQVPTNQIGTGGAGADCWGYVSPSGREYALMTVESGLGVIEITNPTNPVVVAFVGSANSIWHDVKVIGQYAYKVNESGNGIQVIDLAGVDNGNVSLVANVQQGGHTTTHNIVANPDSGYLYLCGANVANGGLIAVDISDPTNPTFVGSWNTRYVHDAQVVNMTVGPYAGREIAFCFNGFSGFDILDVTDKSNITRLGGNTYPALQYCHQGWISADQQWLYVNDELDEGATVSQTTTRVFRIHDPNNTGPGAPSLDNPVYVGTFSSGKAAIDHNLYITDAGVMFQANYRSGLRVFDLNTSDSVPQEIAFFDTYPGSDSAQFNGAWSVYPYFPSGNIIVSDIERGLFVLRLDVGPSAESINLSFDGPLPDSIAPGDDLLVRAAVQEQNLTLDASTITLNVAVDETPVSQLAMTPVPGSPGVYEATVNVTDCPATVALTVTAESTTGELFESTTRQLGVFDGVNVIADAEQEVSQWSTGGSATAGQWEFGTPIDAGRGDPPTDSDGTGQAWLTQNDLGPLGDGNSDVDNGEVSLLTRTYDLSAGGVLEYDYWLNDVPNGGFSPEDYLRVEVRTDGGSWITAREYTTASGVWRSDAISFGPGGDFDAAAAVQFRIAAADFGDGGVIEAGLDNFKIVERTCPDPATCPADLDNSGSVDGGDLLLVINNFGSTGSAGDTNGDNTVDGADLLEVINNFGAGC